MLKLVNIKKDYYVAGEAVPALKGLNIAFRKNEFVAILGPSGCGKTTTLNIIGGLDKYTSGDLIIAGRSTKDFKDRDWDIYRNHRVGFIFQSYNLIPQESVLENVELALTIAGINKEERKKRAREALDRVGLKGQYDKKPNQLSGGQCQRVAIARALVNKPEILLADEPTGALDTKTSLQIMDLIRDISQDTLVIMVTHNPELAQKYATRIVSLVDGEIVEDSNPFSFSEEAQEVHPPKVKNEKAKMKATTAFKLSFKNLLSKKKRTALTCIAGSIGIIGISAVLGVSNGVKTYIADMQDDMLSGNPITVSKSTLDFSAILNMMTDDEKKQFIDRNGYINVDSMVSYMAKRYSAMKDATVSNNITAEYLKFLADMPKEYTEAMVYQYGVDLRNNVYTSFIGEDMATDTRSISAITTTYTALLSETSFKDYASLVTGMSNCLKMLPNNTDYVLSQYDLKAGKIATEANEAVLVIDKNDALTDVMLAQLGYYTQDEFLNIAYKATEDTNPDNGYDSELYKDHFSYEELLNKKYYYYANDDIYIKNASPLTPYFYNYNAQGLDTGYEIKVVGILAPKSNVSYGCLGQGLYYTEALSTKMLNDGTNSAIVNDLKATGKDAYTSLLYNDMRTGITYDFTYTLNGVTKSAIGYVGNTNSMSSLASMMPGSTATNDIYQLTLADLGGADLPTMISFYPKNFKAKDQLVNYLNKWNSDTTIVLSDNTILKSNQRDEIKYTDNLSLIIAMLNSMLDMVTTALIAFTCLSLVVSCVMIAIITFVSVMERVKEIGVIRSLGGRKRDVNNLFNAETVMIGFVSGVFGVLVTYLIQVILNAILANIIGIPNIMLFKPTTAGLMILLSMVLTIGSGLIPASRASHQDPVVALRSE